MTGRGPGAAVRPVALPTILGPSADPAVRAMACRDLLGEVVSDGAALDSPVVRGLLDGVLEPAATDRPYAKWFGSHWRLVSLVELGLPAGHPDGVDAAVRLIEHWAEPRRLASVSVVDGRARRCASQEGNALAVACRLGLAATAPAETLAAHLAAWQWPDGGWNCDRRPAARHSSVHETLPALWGLHEFAAATGDTRSRAAADRAAEALLHREVVFSRHSGRPLHPAVAVPHYPPYWHYDLLHALLVLHRAGHGDDPRTTKARDLLAERRRNDGSWRAARRWWRPPGTAATGVEAVDWGEVADQMVTLNALRVGAGG